MEKFVTQDNLCYYKKDNIVYSRQATFEEFCKFLENKNINKVVI